jgi:DNA-binding NtrC family response regulator
MPDHILLVTAEEALARLGELALAGDGDIRLERDAALGIAACERLRPDVVVWDAQVAMPDGGPPPIPRLRGSGAGVVVVVPRGETPAGVRALGDGAEQFLEQPVTVDHLVAAVARAAEAGRWRRAALQGTASEPPADRTYRPRTLEDVEREQIERALRHHSGNRTRTARELGISRATLINKIKSYALDL